MASFVTMSSTRQSDETMEDDDDKDDTKRKSRNLSEKKRRDQFNMLINELGSMVTTNTRKMDKSTVLKSTMLFLKNHNEIAVRSRAHEIQEDWKPAFLSNEEFTHLILEALDGFIMVLSSNGRIYYASESVTSLLGYLPSELANSTIYEITYQEDQSLLYNILLNPARNHDSTGAKDDNQVSFTCHIKRGRLDLQEEATYERVDFAGYFRSDADIESLIHSSRYGNISPNDTKVIFVGTGRLHTPQLIQDMSLVDGSRSEFTSRHSLEWKFLFLDHRAPPIIGYLPFEVLGTSGYDYYHVDDLDKVVTCHESLMQKGEGTSCHYRFLTKGQQWIWLQTRFYIDYNQWNSKPEFIVCTHNVVSYTEVMKQLKQVKNVMHSPNQDSTPQSATSSQARGSLWSPTSWKPAATSRQIYQSCESDPSANFRQSTSTIHTSKPQIPTRSSSKAAPQLPETPPRSRQQLESDSAGSSYAEPLAFAAEPILTDVSTPGFLSSTTTTPRSLPTRMLVNQPNIITTTQNQMQDELQRKHEELQQLIVHQQEELRRVSEQLLNAKYGILYPLINVALPYDANSCQGSVRCDGSPGGDAVQSQAVDNTGMNVLSVPMNLPVTIVDTFSNSTAVASTLTQLIPPSGCADSSQSNSRVSQLQLPQQQRLLQKHDVTMEHMQPQAAPVLADNQMIPFDMCQQEMMYSNLGAANGQQSTARNQ